MSTIDKEALKERYRAERDKRLRPDGNDQYVEIAGQPRLTTSTTPTSRSSSASRCATT